MSSKLFLCNKRSVLKSSLNVSLLLAKPANVIHLNKTSTCLVIAASNFHASIKRLETGQNRNAFKINQHLPIFSILFEKSQKRSTNLQARTVMRGGPGYTKFGHGRYKPVLSKYAYFWYIFLVGSICFGLFFDFENVIFRGLEPQEKIDELKMKYNRDYKPRAKEIESANNEMDESAEKSNSDESDEEEQEESNKTSEKKSKTTFRDRKVMLHS